MDSVFRLDGKLAVVTGAARGIGRAIAERLAAAGARIVIADMDGAEGRKTATDITKTGAAASFIHLDVTDRDNVARACETVCADLGIPHVLVNNAGIVRNSPATEMNWDDWQSVIDIDLGVSSPARRFSAGAWSRSDVARGCRRQQCRHSDLRRCGTP